MQIIKQEINEIVEQLLALREKLVREVELYPDGRLTARQKEGAFYIASRQDGKYRRKKVDDETTLKSMARKEYLVKVLPQIDVLIKELAAIQRRMENFNTARVIETMKFAYKLLPDSYFTSSLAQPGSTKEAYLLQTRLWAAQPYEKSDYKPEERKHITSQGEKVRSKSEVLSCEFYYQLGLGFRYEEVTNVGGVQLAPDFKIYMPDRTIYYHEHAGMMDDPEYRSRHERKMRLYSRCGIVQWENLLVTYDRDGTINMEEIQHLIKGGVVSKINAMFAS